MWFERGTPPCVQLFVDAWGVPRLRHVPALDDPRTGRPLRLRLDAQHGVRVALAHARRAAQHARLRTFLRTVLARGTLPSPRCAGSAAAGTGAMPQVRMLPTGEPFVAVPLCGGGAAVLCANELTGEITVDTRGGGAEPAEREHAKGSDTLGTALRHAAQDAVAAHARAAGLVPLLTEPPAFMPRSCATRPWAFTFSIDRNYAVSAFTVIPFVAVPPLHHWSLFVVHLWCALTETALKSGTWRAVFQGISSAFVLACASLFHSLRLHGNCFSVPQDDSRDMFGAMQAFVKTQVMLLVQNAFSVAAAQLTRNDAQALSASGGAAAAPAAAPVPPMSSLQPIAFRHRNAAMTLTVLPGMWQVCGTLDGEINACVVVFHVFAHCACVCVCSGTDCSTARAV